MRPCWIFYHCYNDDLGLNDCVRVTISRFSRHLFHYSELPVSRSVQRNSGLIQPCSQLRPPEFRVGSSWADKESHLSLAGRAFTFIYLEVQLDLGVLVGVVIYGLTP
jgi:hypothetical protein